MQIPTTEDLLRLLEGDFSRFSGFVAVLANSGRIKREHLLKANKLAAAYAAAVGLDAQARQSLLVASTLADLGELAIPAIILSKPGKLEKEDQELIRRHPQLGYEMLSAMRDCDEIARTVLYHQEHFDGSGYPAGLKGEEIPLLARILAVLEAYAAMTSDRPHRRALSIVEASRELQAKAGAQFDPAVVEKFLNLGITI